MYSIHWVLAGIVHRNHRKMKCDVSAWDLLLIWNKRTDVSHCVEKQSGKIPQLGEYTRTRKIRKITQIIRQITKATVSVCQNFKPGNTELYTNLRPKTHSLSYLIIAAFALESQLIVCQQFSIFVFCIYRNKKRKFIVDRPQTKTNRLQNHI